jgi:hypothetical protein
MIKIHQEEYEINRNNYREIIKRISSQLRPEERAVIKIDIKDHVMLNLLLKTCRENDLSVIYGYNDDKTINLIITKRR